MATATTPTVADIDDALAHARATHPIDWSWVDHLLDLRLEATP